MTGLLLSSYLACTMDASPASAVGLTKGPDLTDSSKTDLAAGRTEQVKEDIVEKQNARMRMHWDDSTCRELEISNRYSRVACLLIQWHDDLDKDLQCSGEVTTCVPRNSTF
jgi:hypothetical protein